MLGEKIIYIYFTNSNVYTRHNFSWACTCHSTHISFFTKSTNRVLEIFQQTNETQVCCSHWQCVKNWHIKRPIIFAQQKRYLQPDGWIEIKFNSLWNSTSRCHFRAAVWDREWWTCKSSVYARDPFNIWAVFLSSIFCFTKLIYTLLTFLEVRFHENYSKLRAAIV